MIDYDYAEDKPVTFVVALIGFVGGFTLMCVASVMLFTPTGEEPDLKKVEAIPILRPYSQ